MKKQVLLIVAILLLAVSFVNAQTPNWLWAKSAEGAGSDFSQSVTTDAVGNIIVTGFFYSPTITLGTTILTNAVSSSDSSDFFIVKYDVNGNVLWAKSAGGNSNDEGYSVTTDVGGNIIVTGYFASPTITFGTTTLTNAGYGNIFIVKYASNGNVLWAKSAGGAGNDGSAIVTTDVGGNIIVSGSFKSNTITFGTTTLTNTENSTHFSDFFIVKFNSNGNVLWAKRAGGFFNDGASSVTTDAGGNIIVVGIFENSTITFGTTTLTTEGCFIVKYDGNGNVLWAKKAGGHPDKGYSITTDAGGNIIVTGEFYSPTITFGTITLTNVNSTNSFSDFFIVKYDGNGNVLWAKSAGGIMVDYGISVTTDAGDNIIVTGSFNSSTITFGSTTLVNAGDCNVFIVKYDSNGNVLWAKSVGGNVYDSGEGVITDAIGNIFVTGSFNSPTITFGTTTLTNNMTNVSSDFFLAKLDATNGVKDIPTSQISIFPNPTNSQVIIKGITHPTVLVYNLMGQKVAASQGCNEVSLATLPPGMYMVQVFSKDMAMVKSEKVVKE